MNRPSRLREFTNPSVNSITPPMLSLRLLCFGLLLSAPWAWRAEGQTSAEVLNPGINNLTTSRSAQFKVYGSDKTARGTFASFAERQKAVLLRALQMEEDTWHHPIVIRVSGEITNPPVPQPVSWRINLLEGQQAIALEVRVKLCTAFSREELLETLYHMLLLEIALRDVEIAITDKLIPRWLQVGLPKALEMRRTGRQSGFFKKMFELNLVASAADILSAETDGVDSVARTVYQASAAGFVLMLLDQKDGATKLGQLIHAFGGAHGKSGHNLLARFYPSLIGTAERLEQTWILYCGGKLTQPQATDFLSPRDSETQLADAIQVRFLEFVETSSDADANDLPKKGSFLGSFFNRGKDDTGDENPESESTPEEPATKPFEGTLEDFNRFLAREDRAEILAPVRERLLQLSFRSFPLHRPLVNDYLAVVTDLRAGKPQGIDKRLAELKKERERLADLMHEASAFMDAHEAEHEHRRSGVFDNYMDRIKAIENRSVREVDPIHRYLDEAGEALK